MALRAGIAFGVVLLLGFGDYVRLRFDQRELDELRVETAAQRDRIERFDDTLADVEARLREVREFERKVRIIANLPGSAGTGGADVVEVGERLEAAELEGPPQGAPGLPLATGEAAPTPPRRQRSGSAVGVGPEADEHAEALRGEAEKLGDQAGFERESLEQLISQLEGKRHQLESSPSIWPAKGWMTSRFGMRVSPFTGRQQFHAGIDIAAAPGTDIVSPARGKVTFAGKRGPLGNALIIDHGYGVKTLYGHNQELFVKKGDEVERGQLVASLGNSGRSTGPHLHYVVEVNGKAKNPLDYIFD